MDLSNAYKKLWKNSFNFKGTATRSEYWWIVLINFMIIYSLTLFGEELEMYLRQYTICT
ncbi:MAG: DUF805 domain-containing protein [Clostridia bacterium]|nr:DUF805 domain-containing protein [Clostridia bacterium]